MSIKVNLCYEQNVTHLDSVKQLMVLFKKDICETFENTVLPCGTLLYTPSGRNGWRSIQKITSLNGCSREFYEWHCQQTPNNSVCISVDWLGKDFLKKKSTTCTPKEGYLSKKIDELKKKNTHNFSRMIHCRKIHLLIPIQQTLCTSVNAKYSLSFWEFSSEKKIIASVLVGCPF